MKYLRAVAVPLLIPMVFVLGYFVGAEHGVEERIQRSETPAVQDELVRDVPAADPVVVDAGGPLRPVARGTEMGKALATMRIPRFGKDWEWTAVEGVDEASLAKGPGHYPWTPLPGEQGNVAFAAHRAGHGDPFIDFDLLQVGDRIEIAQRDTKWVYEVTRAPEIIEPDEVWVVDPTPGRMLTLTTCWPKYGSEKRMFIRARLVP